MTISKSDHLLQQLVKKLTPLFRALHPNVEASTFEIGLRALVEMGIPIADIITAGEKAFLKGDLEIRTLIGLLRQHQHPEPEVAFGIMQATQSEAETFFYTEPMRLAWAALGKVVVTERDRFDYKKLYSHFVELAIDNGDRVPTWQVSLGCDRQKRVTATEDAVKMGLLKQEVAYALIPDLDRRPAHSDVIAFVGLGTHPARGTKPLLSRVPE